MYFLMDRLADYRRLHCSGSLKMDGNFLDHCISGMNLPMTTRA